MLGCRCARAGDLVPIDSVTKCLTGDTNFVWLSSSKLYLVCSGCLHVSDKITLSGMVFVHTSCISPSLRASSFTRYRSDVKVQHSNDTTT